MGGGGGVGSNMRGIIYPPGLNRVNQSALAVLKHPGPHLICATMVQTNDRDERNDHVNNIKKQTKYIILVIQKIQRLEESQSKL